MASVAVWLRACDSEPRWVQARLWASGEEGSVGCLLSRSSNQDEQSLRAQSLTSACIAGVCSAHIRLREFPYAAPHAQPYANPNACTQPYATPYAQPYADPLPSDGL
eukprot:6722040-Alexandrium_andersonii.AAC.1